MQFYQYLHLTDVYYKTGIIPTNNTRIEVDYAGYASLNGKQYAGLISAEGPGNPGDEWGNRSFAICMGQNQPYWFYRVDGQAVDTNIYPFTYGTTYSLVLDKNGFSVDGVLHPFSTAPSAFTCTTDLWIGVRNSNGGISSSLRYGDAYVGETRVYEDNVLVARFRPTQYNGDYTYYDAVSDTYLTKYGPGTVVPGPSADVFEPSQDTFTFNGNGGTQTFTVTADNAWTCTAPHNFTLSTISGNSGTTTVTITAPSRISTVSETVTFTDTQSNTFDISVSQSVGTESPNLTLYQGSTTIKKMYQGTDLIYRKLAVSPTLTISGDTFTFPPTSYTAATVVVVSDAAWTYSVSENWLTVTRTNNNLEIVPASDWDQGSAPRTATITVTANNGFLTKTATITATQKNTNVTNVDWVWVENYGSDTGLFLDTGIYPTVNTSFRVKYIPIRSIGGIIVGFGPAGSGSTPTGSADDYSDYRFFSAQDIRYAYWDFNSGRLNYNMLTTDADGYITVECGNNYVTNVNSGVTHSTTTQTSMSTTGVPIYLNLSNDLKVQSLEIFEDGVKVYDGHSAYDGENYGWNESISGTFTTQTYGGYSLTGHSI